MRSNPRGASVIRSLTNSVALDLRFARALALVGCWSARPSVRQSVRPVLVMSNDFGWVGRLERL